MEHSEVFDVEDIVAVLVFVSGPSFDKSVPETDSNGTDKPGTTIWFLSRSA
jgi:hypothetical protein